MSPSDLLSDSQQRFDALFGSGRGLIFSAEATPLVFSAAVRAGLIRYLEKNGPPLIPGLFLPVSVYHHRGDGGHTFSPIHAASELYGTLAAATSAAKRLAGLENSLGARSVVVVYTDDTGSTIVHVEG